MSPTAGSMIAKTFFLAKIIHRIGTQNLRGKKSLHENLTGYRIFFTLRAARRAVLHSPQGLQFQSFSLVTRVFGVSRHGARSIRIVRGHAGDGRRGARKGGGPRPRPGPGTLRDAAPGESFPPEGAIEWALCQCQELKRHQEPGISPARRAVPGLGVLLVANSATNNTPKGCAPGMPECWLPASGADRAGRGSRRAWHPCLPGTCGTSHRERSG